MLGKLTLDAIPFHDPIVMGAVSFIIIGGLALVVLITYLKRWGWLWNEWFTSVDHKRIGIMYVFVALIMLLRGFSDAIMMRTQQALSAVGVDNVLPPHHYDQVFTAHGVIMIFFVAMPFIIGLMNIVVPQQIGARDVAYPFLNSLSFWLFVAGVVLINIALGVGEFAQTGWLAYPPLSEKPGVGVDYWIWSLQISGVGTLLTGVNFFVTILRMRAPGMKLMQMPVFTWTALCSNILIIAAFPILTATVALLTLDRYLGFNFFGNDLGGNQMMYVNLIWAWGHPEVYILILPCFGIFSEVVATFSRKRLFAYASLVWATVAITVLSFIVWLHHFFTMGAGANVNAFFGIATMVIAIPTGVKVFNWLFTMYKGRVQFSVPILWALGFLITFTIGGMTGVLLAVPGANYVLHNSLFLVAHFHNVIIGGVVFGFLAGFNYWFPKAFGFKLDEKWGRFAVGFWITGFFFAFMPLYVLGFMGMTRRINNSISPASGAESFVTNPEFAPMLFVALFGAGLIALGILSQIIQIIVSIRDRKKNVDLTGDPWDARTLEWATSSPPALYNFAVQPEIHDLDEFWYQKQNGLAYQRPTQYQPIHMPKNTGAGVIIGVLSIAFGFAMIWYIWWLAIVSFLGIIGTWIMHSFNDDVEYEIPAEDVERLENEHFEKLRKAGNRYVK